MVLVSLRPLRLAAMFITVACAAGCLDGSISLAPSVALWEGELTPSSTDVLLNGSIAAVVESTGTRIGIGMHAPEPAAFDWSLHRGSCGMPPELIAPAEAFPRLVPNEMAMYSAETFLAKRLLPNGEYRVIVTPASADGVVACGNLNRR